MNATFTGLHALDDRLPDWSAEGLAREAAEMRRIRDELRGELRGDLRDELRGDLRDKVPHERREPAATPHPARLRDDPVLLDSELARANLDVRLAEYDSGFFHGRNPALWTGEAIFGVVSLLIRDFAPAAKRVPSIRARLEAIPAFLADMRGTISGAMPASWSARAVRECEAAQGLFDRGLSTWLAQQTLPPNVITDVMESATRAREAFATAARWISGHPVAAGGACAAGETLFATLLQRGHFCDEPPRALLARALEELSREQAALATLVDAYGGTWETIQSAMAADHPSVEEYYAAFESRWRDCRRVAVAHDAVTWEEWPIRYAPIPDWAEEFAPLLYWLFYRSPAPFDPYTVYEYVVTPIDASLPADVQEQRLRAWNHSTITLNHVVHHGAVGHHVQNWHARYRSQSRVGRIAATDCASRIAMFLGGSLAEGWACYATQLMEELGMCTPLERLSEQHTRVRMLARAITDIRLHLDLCTVADAVTFYREVVGMPEAVAVAETTKNSMFPCTAIMYWLGTSRILALREQLRAARGERFVLREFHDELLSRGAIPVALAATLMTEPVA